jgi:DNA-directed RNA polymerase specialized sigma24 family protein
MAEPTKKHNPLNAIAGLIGAAGGLALSQYSGAATEAMRRILVERARHRRSLKAGGDRRRQELPDIEVDVAGQHLDLLAFHGALAKLENQDKRRAELVNLRFFAGLTIAEAAQVLGISPSTADNDWA